MQGGILEWHEADETNLYQDFTIAVNNVSGPANVVRSNFELLSATDE